MKKKTDTSALIRHKAEEALQEKQATSPSNFSESEIIRLIHELEVHQIELEMQNEELLLAKEQAEKAAQKYAELFLYAPAGYFTLSRSGEILELNLVASQIFGIEKHALLNRQFGAFVSEDTRPIFNEFLENIFKFHTRSSCDITLDTNLKVSKYLNLSGIHKVNGEECLLTVVDISQSKQMEIELSNAIAQAEDASKAKSDFLANMSHEIRTPLNGIIGFTHLLMNTEMNHNQLEYMDAINESATILKGIINDVLDLSKIESRNLELYIEKIDLLELVHHVVFLFKHQASQKRIDLILKIDDAVPQYIFTDSVRLKQILINLLGNALKFTSFGQIELDLIQIKAAKKNETTLQFSIKDTGIGIKLQNQEKIFQSFIQEDNSTSRKFGGTGLGLSITNQLLGLMNSKLQLTSEFGKGSNFYFILDVKKSNTKNKLKKIIEKSSENKINAIKTEKTIRILVVEDNRINMLLTKKLLEKIVPNSIIFEASDGNEAIMMFHKEELDLILMDVQMPIKNGYEATIEIRKINPAENIPVIALSAGILMEDKQRCFDSGMNDFISKPIVEDELQQKIAQWI